MSVWTPCQWPGQRTVFSANSRSWVREKMKLGMPGVTAHSSSSSLPNWLKRNGSRSLPASTSTTLPSLTTLRRIMYSRSTCSNAQVIM